MHWYCFLEIRRFRYSRLKFHFLPPYSCTKKNFVNDTIKQTKSAQIKWEQRTDFYASLQMRHRLPTVLFSNKNTETHAKTESSSSENAFVSFVLCKKNECDQMTTEEKCIGGNERKNIPNGMLFRRLLFLRFGIHEQVCGFSSVTNLKSINSFRVRVFANRMI